MARLLLLPVLCVALSYAAAENPVTSLDAGEIAEVDEGDFADMFDSKGPSVPVKVVDCVVTAVSRMRGEV